MTIKSLNVTIVGAGYYGLLISKKYAKNANTHLKGIIDPNPNKKKMQENPLNKLPVFCSPKKWEEKFGKPNSKDIFDLCVHEMILISVMDNLIKIGAKNFILPKPIALNEENLEKLNRMVTANNLNVVIASQWHHAKLTQKIKEAYHETHKKYGKPSRIDIVFSKKSEPSREHHTPITTFLPHVFQIIHTSKITDINKLSFEIKHICPEKIILESADKETKINIESNLSTTAREQKIKIYFGNNCEPHIMADFAGIFDNGRFVEYPYINYKNRIHPVVEDVLENMIEKNLAAFTSNKKETLTIGNYIPVAKKIIEIEKIRQKSVAVIGGGIFGILSAIEIAKKGSPITVFEKNKDILLGASLANQCRIHMGYHYPRDKETAKSTLESKNDFCNLFKEALIYKNFKNYYCIAKKDSLTKLYDYIEFCKDMGLTYQKNGRIKSNSIRIR